MFYSGYYNISYEIAAIVVLLGMILGRRKLYKSEDKTVRMFMGVLTMTAIASSWNVFAALTYSSIIPLDVDWMLVIETIYLLFSIYTCYYLLRVVCVRTGFMSEGFRVANFAAIAISTVVLLINIAVKFMFWYADDPVSNYKVFMSTRWFHLTYLIYVLFFMEMAFVLISNGKNLRKRILILTSSIFFSPIICIIIQFVNDKLLLSGVGTTVALLMYSFTLGEEDFNALQETLEELKRIEVERKAQREEAEKVQKLKKLFLAQITERFDEPIAEVQQISKEMKDIQKDVNMDEYINQIKQAGAQLQEFVGELNEKEFV